MGTVLYGCAYCLLSVAWLVDSIGCLGPDDSIAGFAQAMFNGPNDGPELFVFSKADDLVDHKFVEEVIEKRRARPRAVVESLCFEDSPHVGHIKMYPEAYAAAVTAWLDQVAATGRRREL